MSQHSRARVSESGIAEFKGSGRFNDTTTASESHANRTSESWTALQADTEHLRRRAELRQLPERGSKERGLAHEILDSAFLAHVGFHVEGQPFVLPMLYARCADMLYLHGAAGSRLLRALAAGIPACVTITVVDGIVLARSAFHHSINYRSVVAFGTAREICAATRKVRALRALSEQLVPGRWREVRGPRLEELAATRVIEFAIEEASTKVRRGPPIDDEADYASSVWAGVVPLALQALTPVPDPRLVSGVPIPHYRICTPGAGAARSLP